MKCEKCKEPLTRIKGSNNWISKIDATIYCTGTTRKHTPFHEPAEPVAIPLRKVGEGIYTADTGLIRPASLSLPITVDPNWCEVHQVIMSSCEADRRKGCRMGTRPEMPPSLPRIETGNVQFNNDWPGVFFRGDTAINIARQLRLATSNGKKVGFERLASLIDALEDCHVKLDHAIQHVKRAASVQQEPSLECWNCHAEIPAEDRELIACHDCHYKWRNAV